MDCDRARELMAGYSGEKPIDPARDTDRAASSEWSAAEAHVAKCRRCSADLVSMLHMRRMLSGLRSDAPTAGEIESMWRGIESAVRPKPPDVRDRIGWRRAGKFVGLCAAVAACLVAALLLGETRYAHSGRSSPRSVYYGYGTPSMSGYVHYPPPGGTSADVARGTVGQMRAVANMRHIAAAAASYAQDNPAEKATALGTPITRPEAPTQTEQTGREVSQRAEDRSPPAEQTDGPPQRETTTIRTAEISLEVTDYDAAATSITAAARQYGGYVADTAVHVGTGGALSGTIVLRIPPDSLYATLGALRRIGRVEAESVKTADVTADYVDLNARLASLRVTEKRLHEMADGKTVADNVSALLEVEREMTRVRSEIESLEGRLRVMADHVAMSIITIRLRELPRPVPSASLTLEVRSVQQAGDELAAAISGVGAQVIAGRTERQAAGNRTGHFELRLPSARFGECLKAISALGFVTQQDVTGWSPSDAVEPGNGALCDVALTLTESDRQPPAANLTLVVPDFEPARRKLGDIASDHGATVLAANSAQLSDGTWSGDLRLTLPAGQMTAILDESQTLGEVYSRDVAGILPGRDADAPASVMIHLSERPALSPGGAGAGGTMRRYLRDGLEGLYESVGMIAYGLVVMVPWLLVVLLAVWLISRLWWRRSKPASG